MANSTPRQDHLLDHDYDGIQEYDNPMPRWWVWIFWATIAFSLLYWWNPMNAIRGPGRIKEYEQAMAEAARQHPAPAGGANVAALATLRHDPAALSSGKAIFTQNCSPCHRPDAGGLIGPNLTDDYWLHGGTLAEIHKTVSEGVLDKGMPAWGKILKPEQVNQVVVYVASLHGSNPPNPKAPQGTKVEGEPQ